MIQIKNLQSAMLALTRRKFPSRHLPSAYSSSASDTLEVLSSTYSKDSMSNVPASILSKVERRLHHIPHHPVKIIKDRVVHHFHKKHVARTGSAMFTHVDNISPVVTTEQNFDSLLTPRDHPARSKADNYYINATTLLRSHTSAHQRDLIKSGLDRFLVTGDVYRRDEIDSTHYPVFHQMEGVRLFTRDELFAGQNGGRAELQLFDQSGDAETADRQMEHTIDAVKLAEFSLKSTVEALVRDLFGPNIESRWNPCYFPFTHPSYEMEIKFQGEWMEILGSGIMRHHILASGGAANKIGWAFGLGLDRLAMLLFGIQDIRLLWSHDPRFLQQFQSVGVDPKTNVTFAPFSKYPACYKDISFWVPSEFSCNDFYDVVRSIGGDLVERVQLVDKFTHPKTKQDSHCYRIMYRSMDSTVTNEEINQLQNNVRDGVVKQLRVQLR